MSDVNTLPTLEINNRYATIILNNPEKANSLTSEAIEALIQHIDKVNQQKEVLVLQIKSTGKYFCSGYNIHGFGKRTHSFEDLTTKLENARAVTVAAIHGGVYGGGTDLALACDFRVGSENCNMFMPAAKLGLHFYESGLQRYLTRLGINATKKLFFTAKKIEAKEMFDIGFLTHLEKEDLTKIVNELTETMIQMAPLALLNMKKHINRMVIQSLDRQELEKDILEAAQSNDFKEGVLAWKEKRQAQFKGN